MKKGGGELIYSTKQFHVHDDVSFCFKFSDNYCISIGRSSFHDRNKSKVVDFEQDWCDYTKKSRLKLIYKKINSPIR
jgi:hypothetical protein